MLSCRVAEDACSKSSVSETVVAGEEVNTASKDSMAAIGGVTDWSSARSVLYFWTMSKSGLMNCRLLVFDGDLACGLCCLVAVKGQRLPGNHQLKYPPI